MSFSHRVKDELAGVYPAARHCQIAEIAAILSVSGSIAAGHGGRLKIKLVSENGAVVMKCRNLIKRAFSYDAECGIRYNRGSGTMTYIMAVANHETAEKILLATRLMDTDGSFNSDFALTGMVGINSLCCKRAFLRGAFLAGGSISDPEKSYHLEMVMSGRNKAVQMADTMKAYGLEGKIIERRNAYVVYLKEGAMIVDMLNVMEARLSLMELENIRVVKEVRNSVNRKFNCEMANLSKTVNAAVKQIEDIEYIRDKVGLDYLEESLSEIAELRLQHTEISLKDIGERLSVPVGKSCVNHRLRKISRIADELRKKNGTEI